jgi:hypothetical protein
MKYFFEQFFDFVTGGFFNYIGAAARVLFSKKKFSALVEERLSNSIGMLVMTIFLFVLFFWIKMSVKLSISS